MTGTLFVCLLFMSGHATCALAQGNEAPSNTASIDKLEAKSLPAPKTVQAKVSAKSNWKDLTPAQQQALKPLAEHWNGLDEERRRKWLVMSKNFPSLPPAERDKMHSRMAEWVTLSQQQRTQARLNYAETKKLSPEEKAKKWQAYQALSPEEKKKLAAQAPAKPVGVAVVKSVPPKKLAKVPVTPLDSNPGSRLAAAKQQPVQEHTLLPQTEAPQADPEPQYIPIGSP
jgi:hypothetical protein